MAISAVTGVIFFIRVSTRIHVNVNRISNSILIELAIILWMSASKVKGSKVKWM